MVGDSDTGSMPGARVMKPQGCGIVASEYPKLLERVPAIIYVADMGGEGRWHYVSPQIEQILGYSADEWCANPGLWAERLHPEDRDWVLAREDGLGGVEPDDVALEYRMVRRDGHTVWIRDDAVLAQAEDGEIRWHGMLYDITDRKGVEDELERRAAQQAAVALLGEHALEGASTIDLMDEAVNGAARMLGAEISAVWEFLPDEDCLVLRSGIGWPETEIGSLRYPAGEGSQAGYTLLSRAPVVVEDWDAERRFEQPSFRGRRTGAGLSVKIEGGSRGPFGVLVIQSMRPRKFAAGDIDFLQSLANVLADALERQAVEDAIRERAVHDPLTGLPNRVLFVDRLEHALARLGRQRSLAAILFLDLDHFKLVNDSLGHQVGDELLAAAAPRLKHALRGSDTVARFGGDEFGILLEDIASERDAIDTAERIAATFARPFVLSGSEHFVTTSIGIALATGGERADELIRDADAAMYRAKDRGRARYEVFDEGMRGRAIARLRMENDLRRALERDQLRLEYQPVVSLTNFAIVGVEALLRWRHPDRGEIAPSEFIPIAEENGLIEPIGRWVLENACRQASSVVLREAGFGADRDFGEPVGRAGGAQDAARRRRRRAQQHRARSRLPQPRDHRDSDGPGCRCADGDPARAQGSRRAPRARRLRHRLLVAQLPDAAAARRAEGRSLVRRRARERAARHRDHRDDHRDVPGAVARRGGRGRRDLGAGQRAEPARLHAGPGLSLLWRGPGARDHRRTRERTALAAVWA